MLEETKPAVRLAMLVSGRGSTCEAVARACADGRIPGCEIAVVISNVPNAPALERAKAMGLVAVALDARGREQAEHEEAINSLLRKFRINLVCLAGYQRTLSPAFVSEWQGRVLNAHPSLLPAFPGLNAERQAIECGVQFTGCTVHFVDETCEAGVVVLQHALEVVDDDTEETLAERLLAEQHEAYVEALRRVVSGDYEVRGHRYARKLQP